MTDTIAASVALARLDGRNARGRRTKAILKERVLRGAARAPSGITQSAVSRIKSGDTWGELR